MTISWDVWAQPGVVRDDRQVRELEQRLSSAAAANSRAEQDMDRRQEARTSLATFLDRVRCGVELLNGRWSLIIDCDFV